MVRTGRIVGKLRYKEEERKTTYHCWLALGTESTISLESIFQVTGTQNSWFLFSSYLSALAQSCTDATLAKWKDRLGGADIFTWSHCNQMMQSLRANDGFAIDGAPIPQP
jgi:hypothetical protein